MPDMTAAERSPGMSRADLHRLLVAGAAFALLCGLLSLALGQDRNWDLRNYHLYNAYAWLEGRLQTDLAPAQLQSYFAPLLDVPYLWMARHGAAEWAGFMLGALHGFNFVLVAAIAWRLLESEARRLRAALLLALAGCTGAAFLSELGNTMGDNTTAVFVLGAVLLLVPRTSQATSWRALALAGVLLGFAVGLKLTNAMYAVGLGVAVMLQPGGRSRMGAAAALAASALVVFALVAGPWYWSVWEAYGNPLFPQFNGVFGAPLAQPISVADHQWGPRGFGEALVWPLLFTADPQRVGTSPLPQILWAVLYGAVVLMAVRALWRRRDGAGAKPEFRFIATFFLVAFLAWVAVFNIYRYLVVLELIAPLLLWRLLRPEWPRAARFVVFACALFSLAGWNTWGHAGWNARDFTVETPRLNGSPRDTVLLVGSEPMAWMVPFFPGDLAFASVASNFPESPAYRARVADLIDSRGGAAYAIVPAAVDRQVARVRKIDALARRLGLGDCDRLRWLVARVRIRAEVAAAGAEGCRLQVPEARLLDVAAENHKAVERARQALQVYGLSLAPAQCRVHAAAIGDASYPYQWCPLVKR
jgi:hypothetical protein